MTTTHQNLGSEYAAKLGNVIRHLASVTGIHGPALAATIGCRPAHVDARLDRLSIIDVVALASLLGVSASTLLRMVEEA